VRVSSWRDWKFQTEYPGSNRTFTRSKCHISDVLDASLHLESHIYFPSNSYCDIRGPIPYASRALHESVNE